MKRIFYPLGTGTTPDREMNVVKPTMSGRGVSAAEGRERVPVSWGRIGLEEEALRP